jgi:excisionase family DNA binding protein
MDQRRTTESFPPRRSSEGHVLAVSGHPPNGLTPHGPGGNEAEPRTMPSLPTVEAAVRDEIFTVSDVANALRCSKAHVCNLISGKVAGVQKLPALKLGRRYLVRLASLRKWMSAIEGAGGILPTSSETSAGRMKGKPHA